MMCDNCVFRPKNMKSNLIKLLNKIDTLIAFPGKKISQITLTTAQYKLLQDSLVDPQFHNPMRRHGVIITKE